MNSKVSLEKIRSTIFKILGFSFPKNRLVKLKYLELYLCLNFQLFQHF